MKKRLLPSLLLILIASVGFAQTHTITVTVPDTVVVCYAAGTFNGWNPSSDSMTMISESPKMYSLDIEVEGSADSVEYKFLAGPDWKYQQKQTENFLFIDDSATAVVDTFNAIYHLDQEKDVTIDVLVPVEVYQLNLTGSFNGWNPTANPMELVDSSANGKEFMITIHTLDTTTLEFKFIAGPGWPYEQTDAANHKYMDGNVLVLDDVEDFKDIYNPNEAGDITLNITVPEGTPAVWILGSYNNWALEGAIQATLNEEDSTYTAVIPMVADLDYRVYNFPDWAYAEADSSGEEVVARAASYIDGPVFNINVIQWVAVHVPTGIKDPISATYKLYSTNGTIVVEGVDSNVTIFDLNGRLIQSVRAKGIFVSKTLRSGLYIIRIDTKAEKIVVP